MRIIFSLGCLTLLGAINVLTAQDKVAEVSSMRPSDLRGFDSYPLKVKEYISYALNLTEQGLRYQFGSCDPINGGMDCSGTVQHVLTHLGHRAPRQSNTLYLWVRNHHNLTAVKGAKSLSEDQMSDLKPGDLLFWEGTYDTGERFPPTSHVMIYLGHRIADGKPVMVGASSGRSYDGKARHGVSVFDFRLPRSTSRSKFVGYGPVPGVKSLAIELPPLVKPEKDSPPPPKTEAKPSVRSAVQSRQRAAVAKSTDSVTKEPWRYLVYLPEQYQPNGNPLPMLLYLHGRSIRGRDLNKVKRYGPPALLDRKKDFPFVVISPQLPDGSWPAESLLTFVDEMIDTYRVDPKRVYLTGTSLGAVGAWYLAAANQEKFAAMSVIGGYGGLSIKKKLTDLPIWGFHGAKDKLVAIQPHRDLITAINEAGGNAKLTEYPDGTHGDIIMPVYQNQDVYDWFLKQVREPSKTVETPIKASPTPPKPPPVSRSPSKPAIKQIKIGKRVGPAIKKFVRKLKQ